MSKKTIQDIALEFLKDKSNKNFSILINRLTPGLRKFTYDYVKDVDICNEIISLTFVNIWEKIDQYDKKYNFSTWSYAIAKNIALGYLRYKKKFMHIDNNNLNFLESAWYTSKKHSEKIPSSQRKMKAICSQVYNIKTECYGPKDRNEAIEALNECIKEEINKLKEPYKSVIYQREIEKMKLSAIAKKLKWPESTVKTRLRKARKDITYVIKKKYPELIEIYYANEDTI